MKRRNNKGIATWLKWLLIVMAVGTVLLLATCGLGIYFIGSMGKDMMDPEKAKALTGTMVSMRDLPPTYKYAMGMDLLGTVKMSMIEEKDANMIYMIMSLPNEKKVTADALIDQMAEQGLPSAGAGSSSTASRIEVKDKGKMQVGGVEMPYVTGMAEDKTGKKSPAFMGCIEPTPDKAVMIVASSKGEGDLDMSKVKAFLGYIESFK